MHYPLTSSRTLRTGRAPVYCALPRFNLPRFRSDLHQFTVQSSSGSPLSFILEEVRLAPVLLCKFLAYQKRACTSLLCTSLRLDPVFLHPRSGQTCTSLLCAFYIPTCFILGEAGLAPVYCASSSIQHSSSRGTLHRCTQYSALQAYGVITST